MQTFPMFLTLTDRQVLIVGGGEQAAQKCRLMLKTCAEIVVQADELDLELQGLADEGRITQRTGPLLAEHFAAAALTFICTGNEGDDKCLHMLAKTTGTIVNVVDQPPLCDAFTPSLVDRDPVVVAIGTEGKAPVLARQIKTRLEEMLEPRLGDLTQTAGRLRDAVAERVPQQKRRAFWRWVFLGAPRLRHAAGAEREAVRLIKDAIEAGGAPDASDSGMLTVAPNIGDPDLLTLQAIQRLQEADLILYDPSLGTGALELARRDADRVPLSGRQSPADIPGLIGDVTAEGGRVVILCPFGTDAAPWTAGAAPNSLFETLPGVCRNGPCLDALDAPNPPE